MSASRDRPSSSSTATMSASTARSWARVRCRSPSSSATRRSRPRREETTTPSVSVSAAKTRRLIGPCAFWPPQPGTAPRTRAVNSCSPIAASLPGSAPHLAVTTCSAASQVTDSSGRAQVSGTAGHATDRKSRIRCADADAAVISWARRRPRCRRCAQVSSSSSRKVAVQLGRQPGDHHAIRLIALVRGVILLLPGDMAHQRLDAHQRKAPLGAQTLHLQPPRPGRLARHRHVREPLPPGLPDRPVQRLTQPERLHPHRLARQHPHIMIDHRERLLVLGQVDPHHRATTRQQLAQPLPPGVPLPVPPRHAATLAHRTSSLSSAIGTPSPNYRTRRTSPPQSLLAEQPPLARCPITTPAALT